MTAGDTDTTDSGSAMIGWVMAYLGALGLLLAAGGATMGHGHNATHATAWIAVASTAALAGGWAMLRANRTKIERTTERDEPDR